MKHSKEPWSQGRLLLTRTTAKWSEEEFYRGKFQEEKMVFTNFTSSDKGKSRKLICICESSEDAKRIAACVNACAGITNEALEKGLISCAVENLAQNLPYDDGNFYFNDVKVWEDV